MLLPFCPISGEFSEITAIRRQSLRILLFDKDVMYAGFAGRLYGCSRLITSGTSNLAKACHAPRLWLPRLCLLIRSTS